jgi:hypothetical protein
LGFTAAAAAVVALVAAAPAGATTLAPWTLQDFVANAHSAVTGTVTAVDVRLNKEDNHIHTYVTVDIDEQVAGASIPDPLVIDHLGGRVGNKLSVLEGAPVFRKGEQIFLFVEKVDETYRTLGFFQGKYVLETDPETGRQLYVQRPPVSSVSMVVDGGFKEPEMVTYGRDELIQRVRDLAY